MKKSFILFLLCSLFYFTSCSFSDSTPEAEIPDTVPTTIPAFSTANITAPSETEVSPTILLPVLELTEDEKNMLLKLGMAERGKENCTECIALIMRTVLNRVEADRFGKSIRSVILAPEQFTPVMDGTFDSAEPNQRCYDALEMVIYGWDESQGALFYEWCEGESWHSKNLHLLFQHCDVRFYD